MELDEFQLRHCSGTQQHKICNPYMVQRSTAKHTCALGLFKDSPTMVKKYCTVEYYESNTRNTEIIPLGQGRVLLSTQENNWAVHRATQSPRIITHCEFCILHLICSCSLRGVQDYKPPVLENCEDKTYETVVLSLINTIAYIKFYEEIDAINFPGQTFQSEGNRHVLPQIEIKRINTSNIVQQDADSAMNLDKSIASMRQNQVIYQTKAHKWYAETSLITNMFQSTIGRIAMAAMTIINIASVALGIFTFFKVRKLAILWAFNQQINPGQAYGNYFKERECVHISELVICVTTLLCVLYLARKICQPLARCLYHRIVVSHNMMYTTASVMKSSCVTRIYLRLYNACSDIPIYFCTMAACPSALSMSKPLENFTIMYLENRFKLHGHILISWHGMQLSLLDQHIVYNFPCRVRVPLGQGCHVKLLLNRNYQIQLLSGQNNFHTPLSIATEMSQQIEESNLGESETDSQV